MWSIKVVNRFVVQVQNCLEECETCVPVANNSKLQLIELCNLCKSSNHPVAKDLLSILTKLHFKVSNECKHFLSYIYFSFNTNVICFIQALLEIHDKIALKKLKKTLDASDLPPTPPTPPQQQQNGTKMSSQAYKIIGLRKKPDEPLVSVQCELNFIEIYFHYFMQRNNFGIRTSIHNKY